MINSKPIQQEGIKKTVPLCTATLRPHICRSHILTVVR